MFSQVSRRCPGGRVRLTGALLAPATPQCRRLVDESEGGDSFAVQTRRLGGMKIYVV